MENQEVKLCLKEIIKNISFLILFGSVMIYIFSDKEYIKCFFLGSSIAVINLMLITYIISSKIASRKFKEFNFFMQIFRIVLTAIIGIMVSMIDIENGVYYIFGYMCQAVGIIIYGLKMK